MTAAADVRRTELAIGREQRDLDVHGALAQLASARVLVTGAGGSIGRAVCAELDEASILYLPTDVEGPYERLDVRDPDCCHAAIASYRPSVILHLAGAKHAPEGETDPWTVTRVNALGTQTMIRAASHVERRIVVASTCKAADPETAYGASKLIAERMALNAGGAVARFYNVVESDMNVFRLWEQLDPADPIPYTACRRLLIGMNEAVALTLWSASLPSGRYTIDPGQCWPMVSVAQRLYPGRELVEIPPRRGDRHRELLRGASERFTKSAHPLIYAVTSPHDPR